ncbi:MAG: ABC transporter permease [Muricomes sp.]
MREYVSVFFTVMFCPLMLLIFGSVYGNEPSSMFNGLGTIDISIPAFTGLIFCGNGIISFPIAVAASRDQGELRRYKMTPMSPVVYLIAEMNAYMLLSIVGVLIMVIMGRVLYDAAFQGNVFVVSLGIVLSEVSLFSCGMLVASVSKNGKMAQALGMLVGFPMMFLSGASMPIETLPDKLVNLVKFLPSYHQVKMIRAMWAGEQFAGYRNNAVYLVFTFIVCCAASVKLFKWEGSRR